MAETAQFAPRENQLSANAAHHHDLLAALQRLDQMLEQAVENAQRIYGSVGDPYRGLYINQDEANRLLTRQPVVSPLKQSQSTPPAPLSSANDAKGGPLSFITRWFKTQADTTEKSSGGKQQEMLAEDTADLAERVRKAQRPLPQLETNGTRLEWLAQAFNLSAFDLDLLLIALAPELDLRYERLYAFLQDDVTRRRPTVDLALNLLCVSAEDKLAGYAHFMSDAPLIRHRLLHLIADPNQVQPPFLSHYLKLDAQVVRFLLGQQNLDQRLVSCGKLIQPANVPEQIPWRDETKRPLHTLIHQARTTKQPLRLYFHGPQGAGKVNMAKRLAAEIQAPLLVIDLTAALAVETEFKYALLLILREAWFQNGLLYLDNLDALRSDEQSFAFQQLLDSLEDDNNIIILAGTLPWKPPRRTRANLATMPFPIPDFAQRRRYWQTYLDAANVSIDAQEVAALADRFRLTPHQIADAVETAVNQTQLRAATQNSSDQPHTQPNLADLFTAARQQTGHNLAKLASKIEPKYTWDDIVLPPDQMAQLNEICNQAIHRHIVFGQWGFDQKLSLGKGLNVLFSGPPGTGKTMAAEIIANQLQLDLYKIDLSQVVSKYIGETEKNLDRIFSAAENANAILFFDEADALFGKRSEVRDSHDRYANIEISYLLQKMEQYEGVAILATNLRRNLDDAFVRRLAFTVHFPFPDEQSRERIWAGIWPEKVPLTEGLDMPFMARQFKLSGGNIKNIALAASFLAAANGRHVEMSHLIRATKREYQKMGKPCTEGEFGAYYHLIETTHV